MSEIKHTNLYNDIKRLAELYGMGIMLQLFLEEKKMDISNQLRLNLEMLDNLRSHVRVATVTIDILNEIHNKSDKDESE